MNTDSTKRFFVSPPRLIYCKLVFPCFRDLVDEAKNYLLLPQERPLMQGPRTRPRKPIRCGEVLFAGEFGTFFFIKCKQYKLVPVPTDTN